MKFTVFVSNGLVPFFFVALFSLQSCSKKTAKENSIPSEPPPSPISISDTSTLKHLSSFPIGQQSYIGILDYPVPADLVKKNNDRFTAAAFYWSGIEPRQNNFDYTLADKCLAFTEANRIAAHGHPLVYFQNGIVPDYLIDFKGTQDQFEVIVKHHIQSIMSRYKGRIASYDVVNEMVDFYSGGFFFNNYIAFFCQTDDRYMTFIGKCFSWARQADPSAKLFYNEARVELSDRKRLTAVIKLLTYLKSKAIPIDGIGIQMHTDIYRPIADVDYALQQLAATGLLVHISELDVSINNDSETGKDYNYTTLTSELSDRQKAQYKAIVQSYRKNVPDSQKWGITLWDLTDNNSWLNQFRKEWPCLYDPAGAKKAAFFGFAQGLVE